MWKYVVFVGSCGCPLKMSLWQACNDWQKLVFSMESKWFLHNPVFHWGKPSIFLQSKQELFWWKEYDQISQAALLYEAQLISLWLLCSKQVPAQSESQHCLLLKDPCRKLGLWEVPDFTVLCYCSLGKYKMFSKDSCFYVFLVVFAHRRNKPSAVTSSYRPASRTDMIPPQFALEKIGGYSVLKGASSFCCHLEIGWKKACSSFWRCKTIAMLCLGVKSSYVPPKAADSSFLYYRALLASEEESSGTSSAKLNNSLGKVINCMVIGVQMSVLSLLLYHFAQTQFVFCCVITGLLSSGQVFPVILSSNS